MNISMFTNCMLRPLQPQKPVDNGCGLRLNTINKDTVSFSASKKLKGDDMVFAPQRGTAKKVHDDGEPAQYYLQRIFDIYLKPGVDNEQTGENGVEFKTRIKSPTSIMEKVASKVRKVQEEDIKTISKNICDEFETTFGYNDIKRKNATVNAVTEYISRKFSASPENSPYTGVDSVVADVYKLTKGFNVFDYDKYNVRVQKKQLKNIAKKIENTDAAKEAKERATYDTTSIRGTKYYAYDIIGGKILFDDDDKKYFQQILDGLTHAVQDGNLKIKSIESNVPDPKKLPNDKKMKNFAYVPEDKLRKLAKIAGAKFISNKSKSGYTSVHINVDLSSDEIFGKNFPSYNNYGGEIQLIGTGVEKLKKVEDLCYKFKDSKSSVDEAYNPFKEHFEKYYTNQSKTVQKNFDNYTYALYLYQRTEDKEKTTNSFPSIKELGFEGKVAPELDFNYLEKLKETCDRQKAKNTKTTSGKTNTSQSRQVSEIKRKANINAAKKAVDMIIDEHLSKM